MNNKEKLREIIKKEVFVKSKNEKIADRQGGFRKNGWIFDFRRVLMKAEIGNLISEIFWEEYKEKYPFQLCSLEVAGIPLVVNLTNYIYLKEGKKDMNSFFIRKSRKKDGLMRMIEGTIEENKDIILVDDIINSGKSFIRQIEVLEELGYKVKEVWSVMSFRDKIFYTYFKNKNIKVNFLFEVNDFKDLKIKNVKNKETEQPDYPFVVEWKFTSPDPNHYYVVSKSNPVLDDEKVYFGSDSGYFWALNQKDGSVVWKFKVGFHARGKSIFSTPTIYKNLVIFGSYDGNLYALDKNTGEKKWINFEADWIGSSPVISEKLGLGFVGLEFGLMMKRGGILAFDLKTGKTAWKDITKSFTHSSPLFLEKTNEVVVGSNDGIIRMYNAKKGEKKWEFKTDEVSDEEILSGFSKRDIKESLAYDSKTDSLFFGTTEGYLYSIDRKTGEENWKHKAEFGFMSTPLVYENKVYASSLDKHLYCLDTETGEEIWKWNASARIFASPSEINGKIYIGANTGRMVGLDPEKGKILEFITVPERITNSMVYNKKTDRYFLPTFANEIYKLRKKTNKEIFEEKYKS